MPLLLDVSEKACEIARGAVAPRTLHETKRVILDWLAATLPGSATPLVASLKNALCDELHDHDRDGATVVGDDRRGSSRTAALINGTASHVVEFDDIFRDAIYHPGSPVIAAALAVGEPRGASGLDLIRAVINGYEISTRIGAAVQPAHYRHWHTTGTVGCFGAAAAAASLLKLSPEAFAHALATAGTFAAGLREAFQADAMSKPLHAGRAAEAGVTAALLASNGFTGAARILDGPAGFGAAMAEADIDWPRALNGIGETFNIESVTLKNHGCCGHTFAAIDGALALMKAHGFTWKEVEHVEIETYRTAVQVVGRSDVKTPFDARFSVFFTVATALVHGRVRLNAFTEERLADPAIRSVMNRISLMVNEALDRDYPRKRGALVRITYRGGQVAEHLQRYRHGDPEEPLTDAELRDKFYELATPVTGRPCAEALWEQVMNLEHLQLFDLIHTLRQAG
jgi:2-methylcitrate dehydratase PrpD